MNKFLSLCAAIIGITTLGAGCGQASVELPTRESKIPAEAVKMTPQTDAAPVKSLSSEYSDPIPMPSPVNTAGGRFSVCFARRKYSLFFLHS